MKIESIDLFYLSMPEVTMAADGSQDALLVRASAGGHVGWGECEASPLTSIAAFVTPMSHGACRPVRDSVLGEPLESPADIDRIANKVSYNSMDLLQASHTWSGIEIALWDLLGRARGEPVWSLLGYDKTHAKTPYASVLFGSTPEQTLQRAADMRARGFQAVKFGWAPFGDNLESDAAHLAAAREGIGADAVLLIDAGQIFGGDADAAALRLPALKAANVRFFEEPFGAFAYDAYSKLAAASSPVQVAGGEAAHNRYMAEHLIEYGGVGYIQIDCGRIGGIGPAHRVAQFARARGVTYINHTFTSNLALSASLQPFIGIDEFQLCEFPAETSALARDLTLTGITPDADGKIRLGDTPGLGIEINPQALKTYGVDLEIKAGGRELFRSQPA